MPGTHYRVEFRAFAFPDTGDGMNHLTYGLNIGRDGHLYVGIGNNHDNSRLYRFDTHSERFTHLGSFRDVLSASLFSEGNYGKLHGGPYQDANGAIWVASYPREQWKGAQSGRLFRIDNERGMQDYGPTPGNQGVYFMVGDDRHQKLYLATHDSHFSIYDLATGEWRDKGKFSSKAPFIGMFDTSGRLYMYGYDGKGEWSVGPAMITRYDPHNDTLETSRQAPPTLWVGAVTPDREIAYTTTYKRADIYRWRFDEWPDYHAEHLGRIDPDGRAIFSNNLSQSLGGELLVVAGTVQSPSWLPRDNDPHASPSWLPRDHDHGVWVFELETGRRRQVARLNDPISRSLGINSEKSLIYWTNANTVDSDGWIWIGINTMPSGEQSVARLIGIRVSEQNAGD